MKLKALQIIILLLSLTSVFTGCSDVESETQIDLATTNLNTSKNRQLIVDLFTSGTHLNNYLIDLSTTQEFSKTSNLEFDVDNLLIEYEECSHCAPEYRAFLIPLFEEIKDLYSINEIISKIEEYEQMLETDNSDNNVIDNLKFTLFSFKEASKYIIDNDDIVNTNTFESSGCGRALGQGLVSGFVTGCIKGDIAGAGGGTVALPVIGTVTGGVAGCVGGGAVGAVVSGFSSWLWCAIK